MLSRGLSACAAPSLRGARGALRGAMTVATRPEEILHPRARGLRENFLKDPGETLER